MLGTMTGTLVAALFGQNGNNLFCEIDWVVDFSLAHQNRNSDRLRPDLNLNFTWPIPESVNQTTPIHRGYIWIEAGILCNTRQVLSFIFTIFPHNHHLFPVPNALQFNR